MSISFNGCNILVNRSSTYINYNVVEPNMWSEIRIDFRATGVSSGATTYNSFTGNASTNVLTIANLVDIDGYSTDVSITTISTSNWGAYAATTSNNSVAGITGGTFLTSATTQVYQSIHYNYGTVQPARYDSTRPQYKISGLVPNTLYTIKLVGSEGSLTFLADKMTFKISGNTEDTQTLNGGFGGSTIYAGLDYGLTFSIVSNSSGELYVWMNTPTGNDVALICGMIIQSNVIPENIVAQFNFNDTGGQSISGWQDVSGAPNTAVRSANYSGTTIGVTSVSTSRWVPFGNTVFAGGETTANPMFVFTSGVSTVYWFTYLNILPFDQPNLQITGLTTGSTYILDFYASRDDAAVALSTRLCRYTCTDNNISETGSTYDIKGNTANIYRFTGKQPKSNGTIDICVNNVDGVDNQFGYICGLRIIKTS